MKHTLYVRVRKSRGFGWDGIYAVYIGREPLRLVIHQKKLIHCTYGDAVYLTMLAGLQAAKLLEATDLTVYVPCRAIVDNLQGKGYIPQAQVNYIMEASNITIGMNVTYTPATLDQVERKCPMHNNKPTLP